MGICRVDWCNEEVAKTGLCNRHYLQMRRHGRILPIRRNNQAPQEFEFSGKDCLIHLYGRNGSRVATAVIDIGDYDLVKDFRFNYQGERYVRVCSKKCKFDFLHQLILGRQWVDHIKGDSLNNRRNNLRPCTNQQNQFNQKPQKGRTSKYKGVCRSTGRKKEFSVHIYPNGHRIFLGCFFTEREAGLAYNKAALKYFGEFAHLNKILLPRR
jgi:hypothetical protein